MNGIGKPESFTQDRLAALFNDEQTVIAEEPAALEQRRDKTGALNQAMVRELPTGKTRLLGNAPEALRKSPDQSSTGEP